MRDSPLIAAALVRRRRARRRSTTAIRFGHVAPVGSSVRRYLHGQLPGDGPG